MKQGSSAMIRWSDDDYQTYSKGRPVDLSAAQARLRRCGKFRRRAFELIHIGSLPVQVSAFEIE